MYKLYDIVKHKTSIKGFWLNKGKVYIDNINIIFCNGNYSFNGYKHILFEQKQQEAIFYIKNNQAYIENKQGNLTILKHRICYREPSLKCSYIKELLKQHGGLTIYRKANHYIIEIWRA